MAISVTIAEQVRSSFRKWDSEGKGIISKDELATVLRFLDPLASDEEIDALFSAAQINHDDKINYERFVTWLFCDIPDVFGKLGIAEFNTAARSKCLWEVALNSAMANAARQLPKAKTDAYFADVRERVAGPEFTEHARRLFLERRSSSQNQGAGFQEVSLLIDGALFFTTDMESVVRPSANAVRAAFDAHDAKAGGRGHLLADEFVDLVRHLQVQVAVATLLEAEARTARNLNQLKSNTALREKGLWEDAMATAIAKACQRFNSAAVKQYFDGVNARLTAAEYVEHVKGAFFVQVDADKDGKVSFDEAIDLIANSLCCAADIGGSAKPRQTLLREVFDAHDTIAHGWNYMGGEEFLNLMRYLQVQVAEAMLPMSQIVKPKNS